MQDDGCDEPKTLENVPFGQKMHVPLDDAPCMVLYVPIGHLTHVENDVAPTVDEKVP